MSDPGTAAPPGTSAGAWAQAYAAEKERRDRFVTLSGIPVKALYTPEDLAGFDPARDLGRPAEFPFTRGVYKSMYRGRLWTMRQFAGFGSAADTNRRYKYLLEHGQTGLSVAFDMPTLMGYDSDHPKALGEVGREGVAIATLEDMDRLFHGIPLDRVSVSMTINGPAIVVLAFFVACAERQGVSFDRLNGTTQTDILKEYQAQKEWLFPPRPSMRIITDMLGYCAERLPKWHPISISGYHIREAGSTAVQELAFTLGNGFAYVEAGREAGLDVDAFAPNLSFFFNSHIHFFEELCKFRAARRIWAKRLRDKYGAKKPESWRLKFHTQTAGCSLTKQQPENNIVRTAYEALAAVLGGTQSLHTNSMDEALALPTEKAVRIALRTQQIIAHETGVTNTVDPLAGSYLVESLTNQMEEAAEAYFKKIDALGGVIAGIETGFFQREIARSAYEFQKDVESGGNVIVGVNKYVEDEPEVPIETLTIEASVERGQVRRVKALKARRSAAKVKRALEAVDGAARSKANLFPPILDAVRVDATLGEICDVLRAVYGEYREPPTYW